MVVKLDDLTIKSDKYNKNSSNTKPHQITN